VILARNIVLDATPTQAAHCRRACGTKRYAWGLAEWQHTHKVGDKPTIAVVKRRWNAHRKAELSTAARAAALLAPCPQGAPRSLAVSVSMVA
jgi:hypothetical protein